MACSRSVLVVVASLCLFSSASRASLEFSRAALDLMQLNFTNTTYPDVAWASLASCMDATVVPNNAYSLRAVANSTWHGYVMYGLSNGTQTDPWANVREWLEWNPQPMSGIERDNHTIPGASRIIVTEPCDYVSNIA